MSSKCVYTHRLFCRRCHSNRNHPGCLIARPKRARRCDGVVTDPTGASIPNAQLVLTNEGTAVSQKSKSGSDGSYRFSLVPPGTYTLTTESTGFIKAETKGIAVDASQTVPVNVKLPVASASTAVEVTTQGTFVQTATSDLATTVNLRTVDATPLLTRTYSIWRFSRRKSRKA